jgi:hypothetical protein
MQAKMQSLDLDCLDSKEFVMTKSLMESLGTWRTKCWVSPKALRCWKFTGHPFSNDQPQF